MEENLVGKYISFKGQIFYTLDNLGLASHIMHQSFASPAPPGPGNSGAFNFSIFKARVKARHCRARVLVKPLIKAPASQGLTITWNNSWELF